MTETTTKRNFIVGLAGASGMPYAWQVLATLLQNPLHRVHLVVTEAGWRVLQLEHAWPHGERSAQWRERYAALPGELIYHAQGDIAATIASGSYACDGMIVVPCSMGTLARIAGGFSGNLLERAADVTMKERRRLVIVPRETPLHAIHLENLLKLARLGVSIVPAMPAFYHRPQTLDDMVNFVAGRIVEALDLEHTLYPCWKGAP